MAPPPAADNFAQRQPITTAIQNICKYYPSDTCLRELLQNADDAGATEIEYVLDTTSYGVDSLLHEGLKDYQGPALLARNNSVFRDEDFASLSSVGDSVKKQDPASTGKFGQGFNAVYHWTDGPWVYSRNWLLILDPHEWWSADVGQPGGPRWDVVVNHTSEEIQNHLSTFRTFNLDHRKSLNQTIIRIPLRTANQATQSKIFGNKVDIEAIKGALKVFGREISEGGLLFLKNIRKIVIRHDNDVVFQAETLPTNEKHAKTRKLLLTNFKELYVSQPSSASEDLYASFEVAIQCIWHGKTVVSQYALQHAMLRSTGDDELDTWARENKLFPWVAVAAPLQDSDRDNARQGSLFTILRLPMPTNLPVHIHGLFGVPPDRGRLDHTHGNPGWPTRWNSFMLEKCVARAWVELLCQRNDKSWHEEGSEFWPKPNLDPVESVQPWCQLDDFVIDIIILENRVVWNVSEMCCVGFEEGYFAREDGEAAKYGTALTQYEVPVVFLKEEMFTKVQERANLLGKAFKLVEPQTIRRFFRTKKMAQVSAHISSLVLEFCLLDCIKGQLEGSTRSELYSEFEGIQLWPTILGTLSTCDMDLLLPRDESEMQLFAASRASTTLDLSRLSPLVLETLLKDIHHLTALMRFRTLDDLAADWPTLYPVAVDDGTCPGWIKRPCELDYLVGRIWTWISERFQDGQQIVTKLTERLWLIPLNEGRLRPYKADSTSDPVLIVEPRDPLFDFLKVATSHYPARVPPLLDTSMLSPDVVRFLRNNEEVRKDSKCTSVHNIDLFAQWLAGANEMLSAAADEDKQALLGHLENLTRIPDPSEGLSQVLRMQLRRLPIYTKVSCHPPFKETTYVRSSLDVEGHRYETPAALPPLPSIPRISFFAPARYPEENLVVSRLEVLQKISVEDLLTRHILPWMSSIPALGDDCLSFVKMQMADWIVKNAPISPSGPWQTEIFSHPIIPLPVQNGIRRFRCLSGMISPGSDLAKLYDEEEGLFPFSDFWASHKERLITYGILTMPAWVTLVERIKYYSRQGDAIDVHKIEALLKLRIMPEVLTSSAPVEEIRCLKWLPAISVTGESVFLPPSECRGADESQLVDLVWGTTTLTVKAAWKKLFGWNEEIPIGILLRQLDGCLQKGHYDKADRVLSRIRPDDSFELLDIPCIPCRLGVRMDPKRVFLPGSSLAKRPLSPYLDEVDATFAKNHKRLLAALKVRQQPLIEDLKNVQDNLLKDFGDQLDQAGVDVAIHVLEIATLHVYDVKDLLVPDNKSRLREPKDIVYGDPIKSGDAEFNFTHPAIPPSLARELGLQDTLAKAIQLNIDNDSENDEDYTPKEELLDKISDTLGRYPILTTFNEFLANADDAKATKITWTLDECKNGPHASSFLLTSELKALQGPALLVHNDGSFSNEDFAGFKDIGRGGKQDDVSSTGMFGMGAITMYHFSDVPMLVSAGSFLALDPQQQVLPKNYSKRCERRVGIKMSIERVRCVAPDQLRPFVGLHDFDEVAEYYNGTMFRLPLRATGCETKIRNTTAQMGLVETKSLLEAYFATARIALLFLRNVHSIEFRLLGQHDPQWTVFAKRTKSENDIFQRIEVISSRLGSETQVDTWCTGVKIVEDVPKAITRSGRTSRKAIECGVAACLNEGRKIKLERRGDNLAVTRTLATVEPAKRSLVPQNVFCRLPTSQECSLPISIHASFAVTGDRRNIPLEDSAENAGWNRWLLENCVSGLYVELLRHLAPRLGQKVLELWPKEKSQYALSDLLGKAFWKEIRNQQQAYTDLLPQLKQDRLLDSDDFANPLKPTQNTIDMITATFDFLPWTTSRTLRALFMQTIPGLVRPSSRLWVEFQTACPSYEIKQINQQCLCQIFKLEENCKILEAFVMNMDSDEGKSKVMARLLEIMIPESDKSTASMEILDGCRVLPRPNFKRPFGTLLWNPQLDVDWNYLPTPEEQQLFSFAADRMVNNKLFQKSLITAGSDKGSARDPMQDLVKANFNVRPLEVGDVGSLLALPKSPTTASQTDDLPTWLPKFWHYLNPRLLAMQTSDKNKNISTDELLSKAALHDHAVYRIFTKRQWRYLTPRQFAAEPCVVKPWDQDHRKICDQIEGLLMIEGDCIPEPLLAEEDSFAKTPSFRRLMRAFERLEGTKRTSAKVFLGHSLSRHLKDVMREIAVTYICSQEYHSTLVEAMLQRLPIWPRFKPTDSTPQNHIAAEDAFFCKYEQMLLSWVKNLSTFVDPQSVESHTETLNKLGVRVLSREQVWQCIKGDIPNNLRSMGYQPEYLKFIRYLAECGLKPTGHVAPNGNLSLCVPDTLYDHGDNMFLAAFREEKTTRFLHKNMQTQDLRSFWISVGLRARPPTGVMSPEHYSECLNAIQRRWDPSNTSQQYSEDAKIIANYLNYERQEFQFWGSILYIQITAVPMFAVQAVSRDEVPYRRDRMRVIANEKTHCALEDSFPLVHKRITWSQTRFLEDPPGAFVYRYLAQEGAPYVKQVFDHLLVLMAITKEVSQDDVPEYLQDVQACYEHFQKNLRETTRFLPGIHEAPVWLNLHTTQVDQVMKEHLEPSKLSAKGLCLNCPSDPLPLRVADKFLVPYEKLLEGLGCKSVVQPASSPSPPTSSKEHPLIETMSAMVKLRDQGLLIDVTFEAEGQQTPAHRVVLAAVSEYCKSQFAGSWGEKLQHGAIVPLEDITFKSLSQMVDFAYTGDFQKPKLEDANKTDDIADNLDQLLDLLESTDRWLLTRLHDLAEQHLLAKAAIYVRPDNVKDVKARAEDVRALNLVKHCEAFLEKNWDIVDALEKLEHSIGEF